MAALTRSRSARRAKKLPQFDHGHVKNRADLWEMKRFANRSASAAPVGRSKECPVDIDLERILWDRAYRQVFLDELKQLNGGPAQPRCGAE